MSVFWDLLTQMRLDGCEELGALDGLEMVVLRFAFLLFIHFVILFKVQPNIFAQIYTIHSPYKNTHRTKPLIYCLLPDKTQATYEALFQEILRLVGRAPTQFHCDFEKAVMNAARQVFVGVLLRGCNFHLFQSWRRQLGEVNMFILFNYK